MRPSKEFEIHIRRFRSNGVEVKPSDEGAIKETPWAWHDLSKVDQSFLALEAGRLVQEEGLVRMEAWRRAFAIYGVRCTHPEEFRRPVDEDSESFGCAICLMKVDRREEPHAGSATV